MRSDVTSHAWVGVGPPGAAELGLEVKDLVGGQVQLGFETDGGTDAREAGDMTGELVTRSEQNIGNVRNMSIIRIHPAPMMQTVGVDPFLYVFVYPICCYSLLERE